MFDRDLATGGLTQKAPTAGCISASGTAGSCAVGAGLVAAFGLAISPDGRNVYSTGASSSAVSVFDRNLTTGALTQKAGTAGCWRS